MSMSGQCCTPRCDQIPSLGHERCDPCLVSPVVVFDLEREIEGRVCFQCGKRFTFTKTRDSHLGHWCSLNCGTNWSHRVQPYLESRQWPAAVDVDLAPLGEPQRPFRPLQ